MASLSLSCSENFTPNENSTNLNDSLRYTVLLSIYVYVCIYIRIYSQSAISKFPIIPPAFSFISITGIVVIFIPLLRVLIFLSV